ncbi:universal stress protein A-like protein [Iris pallida]|uniref:Universal stress protein A-like protein n=1 Tax=Iris pallida TaxID=29817 RepID=A0AAX6F005_IRIPA|nr:universal stress protein A-like protein [Iris pallida]
MAEEATVVGVATGEAEEKKKMKVLVAVDESEGSFYALRWALDHLCGADEVVGAEPTTDNSHVVLLLLHVEQPFQHYMFPAGPGVYATSAAVESIRKGQEENSRCILSRAMKICLEKKVTAETLVMGGDPKDMICQAGEQLGTDLVVVGSRGLSTIKRAFLGSTSDYVAHHAPCPVLIVKPPKHTQDQAARPHA